MGRGSPLLNRQKKICIVMCCGGDSLAVLQNICKHSGDFGVCCVGGLGGTHGVQASEKGTPYPPPLGPIIRSISVNVSISHIPYCVGFRAVLSCLIVSKCQNCPFDTNRRFDRTVPGVCGFRGLKMYSRFVNGSWFPFFGASFRFCGTFCSKMSNLSSLEFWLILGVF